MYTHYETERLILKILPPSSCNSVLRFYKDNLREFEKYNPTIPEKYYTTDYQRTVLTLEQQAFLEGKSARFYIYAKENPAKIIGTISFSDIKHDFNRSAIVGYRFDRRFHHHGYAAESMQKCLYIMTNKEHIHRIEAFIQPDNAPSKRLVERLGFLYEGISYSHTMVLGQWQDMERYSFIANQGY